MQIVAQESLGLSQTSRDTFDMLESSTIIDKDLAKRLKAMVGFRNIAVHNYQTINLNILEQIIEKHLDFSKQILKY